MSVKLYAPFGYIKANIVKVVAELTEVQYDFIDVQWADLKDQAFISKNPLGKIPVLETQNGILNETNAIIRYLARLNPTKGLLGESNIFESSQVDQWVEFCSLELAPCSTVFTSMIFNYLPYNKESYDLARSDLDKIFKIIDEHLKMNTYLVANKLTIADILIVGYLHPLYRYIIEEKQRNVYQNVTRYFEQVAKLPGFVKHFGKPFFCAKEWDYNESKKK